MNLDEMKDFEAMGAGDLIDYIIRRHHSFTRESITEVCGILNELRIQSKNEFLNELLDKLARFKDDVEQHMRKEEYILFPFFKKLFLEEQSNIQEIKASGKIAESPINIILKEHEQMAGLMSELRNLTNGFNAREDDIDGIKLCYSGLYALEQDFIKHIQLENDFLFPKILQIKKNVVEETVSD